MWSAVCVGARNDAGVRAQGGRGVGVAEAGLCVEDFAVAYQSGDHGVAEAVQGGGGHVGVVADEGEPVAEDLSAQAAVVGKVGGEDPGPHGHGRDAARRLVLVPAGRPGRGELVPQVGGVRAEGDSATASGLGAGQDAKGDGPLMLRMRPSRSAIWSAASSPRRTPVSAARRTRRRSCSARRRTPGAPRGPDPEGS